MTDLTNEAISSALTSQALLPTLGALAVIVAMLARRVKQSDPLADQVKEAISKARKPALAGLATFGTILVAGGSLESAVAAGVTVLLSASNLLREPEA